MFTIDDIPERIYLAGSLAPLEICVIQGVCFNTIKVNGFNLGSHRLKILKKNHKHHLFIDNKDMNKIYVTLNQLLSKLSFVKGLTSEKRSDMYFGMLQGPIEKCADKAIKANIEYRFACLCLPFNINGEYPTCKCGQHGVMSLLSLTDNQDIKDEY